MDTTWVYFALTISSGHPPLAVLCAQLDLDNDLDDDDNEGYIGRCCERVSRTGKPEDYLSNIMY